MVTHETYRAGDGRWLSARRGRGARAATAIERATGAAGRRAAASRRCPSRSRTRSIPSRSSTNTAPTRCAGSCCPTARPSATSNGRRRDRGRGALRPAAVAAGQAAARQARARIAALDRKLHQTIAAVGEAIEALQFNKAVARSTSWPTRSRRRRRRPRRDEAIRTLLLLVAPMVPHLAEEAWAALRRERA